MNIPWARLRIGVSSYANSATAALPTSTFSFRDRNTNCVMCELRTGTNLNPRTNVCTMNSRT
eukprot:3922154-Rhodomonas_salina.3